MIYDRERVLESLGAAAGTKLTQRNVKTRCTVKEAIPSSTAELHSSRAICAMFCAVYTNPLDGSNGPCRTVDTLGRRRRRRATLPVGIADLGPLIAPSINS